MKNLVVLIIATFLAGGLSAQTIDSTKVKTKKEKKEKPAKQPKEKKVKEKKEKPAKEPREKKSKEKKEEPSGSVAIDVQPKPDSTRIFFRAGVADTTMITNQDAIYRRPLIGIGKTATALGGYVEANTNYFSEDGVSEGFSMELRRFNIFLNSTISQRIRFLSEVEFVHGTEEISINMAMIDFRVNDALNFRGGILLPQIGMFNANHDSPNWEFVDRPLSSTRIIPSTLSEVGFGVHGKFYPGNNIITYDAYIVNGLQQDIVLNAQGRTFIPAGKSEKMFGEDNNGTPMYNARVAVTNRKAGEIGLSYYGGIYNSFRIKEKVVEPRRYLHMIVVDFAAQIEKVIIQAENVYALIDVPADLEGLYGNTQQGGFVEIIYPVCEKPVLGYEDAILNVNLRGDFVDYNIGKLPAGTEIRDEIYSIMGGVSFRPTATTVFRLNYRWNWEYDMLSNPPVNVAGIQVGFATYF